MSKKQETTQTRQFDPASMSAFSALQPNILSTLQEFMSDPWKAGYFQRALTRASEATGQRANVLMGNILNPALGANISNPSAFMASQMGKIGRGASRERADSLTNLLLGAQQLRSGALGQAQNYQPLETGQKQVQKTSGLGTWLPQVAGLGLGILTGGFGNLGGLGSVLGGGGAAASPAMGAIGIPPMGNYSLGGPQIGLPSMNNPFMLGGSTFGQRGYRLPY